MIKFNLLKILLVIVLFGSFTELLDGQFNIKAHITEFEENTPVLLIGEDNSVLDTAYVKNDRFEFSGETTKEPKTFALYIPFDNDVKYTILFMADEEVSVEGSIEDFPKNLTVKGSLFRKSPLFAGCRNRENRNVFLQRNIENI